MIAVPIWFLVLSIFLFVIGFVLGWYWHKYLGKDLEKYKDLEK